MMQREIFFCIIILIKLDSIIRIRVLCKMNVTGNGNKHYITRHDTRSKHVKNWPPISSKISAIMDAFKQSEPLSFTGNVDRNWKSFIQRFELYLTAINADKKGVTQKIALLLMCAGAQAIDVYNTLDIDENDKDEDIKTKLEGFCAPKKNENYERFVFRNTKQEEGEQSDSFLTKLKLRSKSCNYGDLRDGMIRDQIVYGILHQKTQERLLREADLDLNCAVQVCQANEVSE